MLMNKQIKKNGKVNTNQIPIIPLKHTMIHGKKDVKYIDHTCHNTPKDATSGKYMIKVPVYDSGHPEGWINFVELVTKCLIRLIITTGPAMYSIAQRVLEGDAMTKTSSLGMLYATRKGTYAGFARNL